MRNSASGINWKQQKQKAMNNNIKPNKKYTIFAVCFLRLRAVLDSDSLSPRGYNRGIHRLERGIFP